MPPTGIADKITTVSVKHTRGGALRKMILGDGLTVIVKLRVGPTQPLAVGVTVIVATTGAPVGLYATKLAILPTPLAAKPIEVLSLVHVKLVPAVVLPKVTAAVAVPLHTV